MSTLLARALLTVGRARATGTLRVRAGDQSARIAIAAGTIETVELGEARGGGVPLGERLIAMGVTKRAEIVRALREQTLERVLRILSWTEVSCRFARESRSEVSTSGQPIVDAVLSALMTRRSSRRILPRAAVLNRVGHAIVVEATLSGAHAVVASALAGGATVDEALSRLDDHSDASSFVSALAALGGLGPQGDCGSRHRLLLRKRFALRRGASDREMLDLPRDAPSHAAKRALKKIVTTIHPDRFEAAGTTSIRRISVEVMAELVDAERRILKAG